MKQKKPRLIKIKYTPEGVPCNKCQFGLPVDAKHGRFYCIKPEEKAWIYRGEHVCGKGELRIDKHQIV